MNVWVVDDEAPARRRLSRMLSALGDVEVTGEFEDAETVLHALSATQVDAIFLDVRMPGTDGVTLAQQVAPHAAVVFVTAHDSYAVSAFEVEAVDYLLKPVRPERLAMAVERVRARDAAQRTLPPRPASNDVPRVVSATRGTLRFFDARTVTRFWASEKYTAFVAEGVEQLTEEPLSALEVRLTPHGFVRVHRAELVRTDAICALSLVSGAHRLELADGQYVRISRRCLTAIKQVLGLRAARF